jgi:hypothetical protein
LATLAHSRRTRPADLNALIDLVRARRCDHVFAGEDVRLEMLATLEALAIKLASHGLIGRRPVGWPFASLRRMADVEAVA